MKKLKVGNITIDKAIVQGGMGAGISWSKLASAVSNAGGLGVLSAVGTGILEPDFQKDPKGAHIKGFLKEIRLLKKYTDAPFGVNILMAQTNAGEIMEHSCDEGAHFLFLSAGLLLKLPQKVVSHKKQGKVKLVPVISSVRALNLIIDSWKRNYDIFPDMVVVESASSGGHLAFEINSVNNSENQLNCLFPKVQDYISKIEQEENIEIPLLAEGGIFSKSDVDNCFNMGASGCVLGTRFIATYECDACDAFKNACINAEEEDIIFFKSPLGLWARAVKTPFLEKILNGYKPEFNCKYNCLKTCNPSKAPFCLAFGLINAKMGNLEEGVILAGPNTWKLDKLNSVKDVINELCGTV